MIHVIGVSMIVIALLAIAAIALATVFRFRALVPAFARLRSHPVFEAEWREHQTRTIARIQSGATRLQQDFVALSAAVATLLIALKELGSVVRGTSRPVDLILRLGLPWLAGVLQQKTAR